MWVRGLRGNSATCSALCQPSVTSSDTCKQIGSFWVWFPGGWVCVHSRTLWFSPKNSPVWLGVSPTAATPTDFFQSEVLRLYFSALEPGVAPCVSLPSCSYPFTRLQTWDHRSASHHLAAHHLCPRCPSLPPLLVWMNVCLSPWLSDFHTVWFSGSSGCFLFSNLLLSFFWSCKEAQVIYRHLRLGWKYKPWFF